MSFIAISWRLLPLAIVVSSFVLVSLNQFHNVDVDVIRAMPYLLAVVLFLFAGMFNRSRFVAPIVITLFAYIFIRERLQSSLGQDNVMALFVGLNVLFCAQLVLSALLPEKGMFNGKGLLFVTVLVAGDGLLWFLGSSGAWVDWLSSLELQQESLSESNYWATKALLLCHATTVVILAGMALWRKSVSDYALIITWVAGVLVFYGFATPEVSSVCFSALLIALFIVYQQSNYQVTYMDALTGIPGRRSLEDYLATLGRKYTIAMLDVDHFKKFNDTYGHDVGDQVLKMVAARISSVQGGGKAFRYGGEEFTIVFNRKSADDAFVFLEAVREAVQNYEMTLRSEDRVVDKKEGKKQRGKNSAQSSKVSVTISIGSANSTQGLAPKDVIKLADENLYKAKEAGRNCTIKP